MGKIVVDNGVCKGCGYCILTDETVTLKESLKYSSAMILFTYILVMIVIVPLVSKAF